MNIILNSESLRKGRTNITGEIFFRTSEGVFPEENWNDFPCIILGWWSYNLIGYLQNKKEYFEMYFMEAALFVQAKTKTETSLQLKFLSDAGYEKQLYFAIECSKEELKKEIITASKKLIRKAEQEQWDENILLPLKRNIKDLEIYKKEKK